MTIRDDEYECAMCHEIFGKIRNETWNDELAKQELKEMFDEDLTEDCDLVCDDCWQIVRPDQGA